LREEQPVLTTVTIPVLDQLERRSGGARITVITPLPKPGANQVDERQLDGNPGVVVLIRPFARRAIKVVRRPSSGLLLWIRARLKVPVERRLLIRRADDGLRNLKFGHIRALPCAALIRRA
jgi:hypothetical protein